MADKADDLSLPASVVLRIMKDAVPEGTAISKEARQAISKAASVFVLYCTSCANAHASKVKRKTLAGADVLAAMGDMEFEHFVPELRDSLQAFRKDQQEKKETAAERRKAAQAAAVAQTTPGLDGSAADGSSDGVAAVSEGAVGEPASENTENQDAPEEQGEA